MRRIWAYLGLVLLMLLTAQGGVSDLPERLQSGPEASFSANQLHLPASGESLVASRDATWEAPHGPHLPALTAELETTESESEDDDTAHERVVLSAAARLGGDRGSLHLHARSDASRLVSDPERSLPFARGPPLSA